MSPLTRWWLASQLVGWALLLYGWFAGSGWAIAAAVLVFLLFVVERFDNLARVRRGGESR